MSKYMFRFPFVKFYFRQMVNAVFIIVFYGCTFLFGQNAARDSLCFIHISDVHLCSLDGYQPLFVDMRKHYGEGSRPFRRFLSHIERQYDIHGIIVTGDLIDFYDAESIDGGMDAGQIEYFFGHCQLSTVPIYLTLGNHDITSYWIEEQESTKESFQFRAHKARAKWIRHCHCFRNGTYYSQEFMLGKTAYRLVFLDNSYSLPGNRYLDSEQENWLEHEVSENQDQGIIIFMHRYLLVGDKNRKLF